ncbi:phytoene desaturase family protein [Homoserinibacter sp. YIM 151385]|uniref:phytoene desaturase family protein n=1 Tax=Homoserinibacter sp. YIM 151385 TaxID=2985506 RepID=UPI0022F0D10E|nr:NAD(P)/FAD-dependent oxidoreductase [Homoserinibacter sp. YIM 151385]WBU37431.1 NAD(P)/FAD-dependent oxidoreductase [Homoserinibacter sp. YIM 151385]
MIDATVVGAGPNGLVAAVTLAHAGLRVRLVERGERVGGGMSSAELTLPGYLHDVCSAVHPGALASSFFRSWGLTERVPFRIPEVSYAHPLDGRPAALAYRDLDRTVAELEEDGPAWNRMMRPLVDRFAGVQDFTGNQLLRVPRDPIAAVRYGLRSLVHGPAPALAGFRGQAGPALFAGAAAHTVAPLHSLASGGAGLMLAAFGHTVGWGLPVGGSQAIADALAADLVAHGGEIVLGQHVGSPADLEPSAATLLDTSPAHLARFGEDLLPGGYRRALERWPRGDGVAKVDFATSGPIPWSDPRVATAPTVHLGGTRAEIAAGERDVARGRVPERPYVLLVQPSFEDPSRAPAGHHTVWAYIHVPAGSEVDATELVTQQIERFAPGFRDLVVASASRSAAELEEENPNDPGGEIMGGRMSIWRLVRRPVLSTVPWRTPAPGLFLASASTPPGPSTHGMNGWFAARTALRDVFDIHDAPFA